ncbi:GNAT family N-acetyltransferase [Clostridium tyrobutyricum]|uniref:GNAT family N-acetyltransferase n=1 Tax=Clostridium tyrobutyricum TaxID=1519 RepID=UPI00057E0165|nr:GNAT family N-acetyltransferase [Clostridium tyrobutyricum]
MNFTEWSTKYIVRPIEEKDIEQVYLLCKGNPIYYEYMKEDIKKDSIKKDMVSLPPYKSIEDKYYLGYYDNDELIAVLELVFAYPDDDTVLIGFFMVNASKQGQGIGSSIIKDASMLIKRKGYVNIVIGYAEGNVQSREFWKKNMFIETDEIDDYGDIKIVTMLKLL